MLTSAVTRDGSPVAVYLALPAGETPAVIHAAVPAGADVLDLGCGVGRIGGPLVALGHRVVGVDDSVDMLAEARARHIETVHGSIETLDLGRRFDAVLLLSHLINVPDAQDRARLWTACARHLAPGGVVIVERHDPDWVRSAQPGTSRSGDVRLELTEVEHHGDALTATVVYTVNSVSWRQRFTAVALEDDAFAAEAAVAGLVFDRWLDESRKLARFVRAADSR